MVYGGRYLAISLETRDIYCSHIWPQPPTVRLKDVISCAQFNPEINVIDLVTTYNVALQLRLESNTLVVSRKSVCNDRSTLYCSHIRYGDAAGTWTQIKIFGGTALGEVLIWSPDESGHSIISYRFPTPRVSAQLYLSIPLFN